MLHICPICLDPIHNYSYTTLCKHKYHLECYNNLLKHSIYKCTICRANINNKIVYEQLKNDLTGAKWTIGKINNNIICSFPMWIF